MLIPAQPGQSAEPPEATCPAAPGLIPGRVTDPARLSSLAATGLIDGPGRAGLDRLTWLASHMLGAPIALVSLVSDAEQFFASAFGLGEPLATLRRTPLTHSFCQHVVARDEPLVLADARLDEGLCTNLAIPDYSVIAYAGFPLRHPDGYVLGSFCAIDTEPRHWSQSDLEVLENLTEAAASEIALLLANQDLTRSSEYLQEVLSSAHDAFISLDAAGTVIEWNQAAEQLFGWSRAEALGLLLTELIVPERYAEAHRHGMSRVREGALVSRRLEQTARNRAGVEFLVQMTLQVVQHADGPVIHSFLYGVTAHRDREVGLQKERTFLAAVVDSVDVGVVACGSDGRTALFNKAMRRLWGAAPEPATFREWSQHVGLFDEDGVSALPPERLPLALALAGEQVRDVELVIEPPGGRQHRFLANAQPVITAEGRGVGAVLALHDITEQRRGQRLRAAQDAAARTLSETVSIPEGIAMLLGDVCAVMGWAGGEYWQVDPERNAMVRLASWWDPGVDGTHLAERDSLAFGRGEGLPGEVWASGTRIWVGDLQAKPQRYPRLAPARALGLNAAIALPNQSGENPGVLLFLAERMDEPDRELLISLEGISAYVGRFLDRRRARDLLLSLANARRDFERVIDRVNDYVWTVELLPDGQTRPIFASSTGQAIFGAEMPDGGALTPAVLKQIHPEDRERMDTFRVQIRSGHPSELECRVIGCDGVTRWIWFRAAVRHEEGRAFVDGICANVTARKQGELELDVERRRLRQAQAIGRMGSWEWDAGTDAIVWSAALAELYGVEAADVPARQLDHGHVHPDDVAAAWAALRLCLQTGGGFAYRYRVIRPDGEVRDFDARGEAIHGPDGAVLRLVGTAMDVTEQVEAQRRIASREAMLSSIMANSQSLIYVKDLEGRYLMANSAVLRLLSRTEDELIGKDDTSINPVMAPIWRANDQRAEQGEFAVEEWIDTPDGRLHYDTIKFPLRGADGEVYATCGISLDVTARRQAAEAMARARDAALAANAAKSSFLATMSHEIRTPMNAVIGMTDLLLDTELSGEQLEYVQTVRTGGDALLAVINDILDFSRIDAGEMELEERPFDLRRAVEDSLALVAGQAGGLDLVAYVDPQCPGHISGDVTRLRQVLVNLVGNAVKFTHEGDVLVEVVLHRAQPEGGRIRLSFSVRDTGIGIPQDRMDRLFKSFSQVDASTTRVFGGSGLGLAISQAIVEAMGGRIAVTSEVGVGSTFRFDIEFEACEQPEPDPVGAGLDLPDLAGRRVLVVDDNDTNRRNLRLQLEGWQVICADLAAPEEALAVIREGARFDVAILDMNMPDLDGVELAQQLRLLPAGRDLPLILLTSLNSKPRSASTLFAGFHTKPIRSESLRTMLIEALSGGLAGPGPGLPERPVEPDRPAGARQASQPWGSVAGGSRTGPELGPVPEPGPAGRLRVLLAEDNLVNQKVAQGMLRNLGHDVVIAADGQEALEAVLEREFDVILMDIHMPTMDGLNATRAIRARVPAQRQPHIVAMTASSLPEDRRACALAGMNDYLLKPVRSVDLAQALRAVPGLAQAGSASPTPPAPPAPPAVDLAVFTGLLADMSAGSPAARAGLVEAYLEQGDRWMEELAAAGRDGDLERIHVITHTLGSSSRLLGAGRLSDVLAQLAGAAEGGPGPALDPALTEVAAEYDRVRQALLAQATTERGQP